MGSADTDRLYMCIDLKCFYASVECADLGLDPFMTPLVVAEFPFCYSAVGNLEESAKLPAVHPGRFAQFEDFVFAVHKVVLIYVKHATQLF